jgi:hypothetical protein
MQQVNLLNQSLVPRVEPLVAGHMLMLWGGFALILGALTVWHWVSLNDLEAQKREGEFRMATLREEAALQPLRSPQEVVQRIEQLRARLQDIEQLLGVLGSRPKKKFSDVLTALSDAQAQGLWLTEILVDQKSAPQLSLRGRAEHSEAIPLYLQNLTVQENLAGQTFAKFDVSAIQDPDASGVTFSIQAASSNARELR